MLLKVLKTLQEKKYNASLRGEGKSKFLFVKGEKTSLEVSEDEDNCLWIEYWDSGDEGCEDAPIKDDTYCTVEDAIEAIVSWIS